MKWLIVVLAAIFIFLLASAVCAFIAGRRLARGDYPDEYGDGGYSDVTGYRGQKDPRDGK